MIKFSKSSPDNGMKILIHEDRSFAFAESFRSAWQYGFDNSYYFRLEEKIKTIEPDEITALAKTYYNTDDLYQITAG